MLYSFLYESCNINVKKALIAMERKIGGFSRDVRDFERGFNKLDKLCKTYDVTQEQVFTIQSIKHFIENNFNFSTLDNQIQIAENKKYNISLLDQLLFKGMFVFSRLYPSRNADNRITIASNTLQQLNNIEFKSEDNPYYQTIKGCILCFDRKDESAISYLKKARKLTLKQDYFICELINSFLWQLYSPNYERAIEIVNDGLNERVYYWDYVIRHMNLLRDSGKYSELYENGKNYLNKLPECNLDYYKWKKYALYIYLLNVTLVLGEKKEYKHYLSVLESLFQQSLKSSPLYVQRKILLFQFQLLYAYYFAPEIDLDEMFNKKYKQFSNNLIPYFRHLRASTLLPIIINYNLRSKNFKNCSKYIELIPKGKGMGKEEDRLLDFYYYYFLTLHVSNDLGKWTEYNLESYEGDYNTVVLKYLRKAEKLAREISIQTMTFCLVQKINYFALTGVNEQIDNAELMLYKSLYGFEQMYLQLSCLLYYFVQPDSKKYWEVKEELTNSLKHYNQFSFHNEWIKKVEELTNLFSLNIHNYPKIDIRRIRSDYTQLKECANFIQDEMLKSIIKI